MDRRKPIWRSPWSRFRIRIRRHQPQGRSRWLEEHPPNWPPWTRWTIFTAWAHRSTCRTFRIWRIFLLDRKRWNSSRRRWQARPRPRWALGIAIFTRILSESSDPLIKNQRIRSVKLLSILCSRSRARGGNLWWFAGGGLVWNRMNRFDRSKLRVLNNRCLLDFFANVLVTRSCAIFGRRCGFL